MKILQVNCVYGKGSTGSIVKNLHLGLKASGIHSLVCYGRGNKNADMDVVKICGEIESHLYQVWSRFSGLMYGGCPISTKRLKKTIERENPDIVHLHCINGYFINIYSIINFLKNRNQKTILTLHAEFMHTANCGHAFECEKWKTGCKNCGKYREITQSFFLDHTGKSWEKMRDSFEGFEKLVVIAVSPWLMERAKCSPFYMGRKCITIMNGLDHNVFHYYEADSLRVKHNLVNRKVIFHATPNFTDSERSIKGGRFILDLALRMTEVVFVVAGPYQENVKIPKNIILLGDISNPKELAKWYSLADVTVLTSRRETFSMVVAESLCCGTPVAGFCAGGPESIAIEEYSSFVAYGNTEELEDAIKNMLEVSWNKKIISSEAIRKYSTEIMTESYMKAYKNLLESAELRGKM